MKKERRQIIEQNEISDIYTFELGGCRQKVLIEGKSRNLPVLISLHGGPGTPIPFSAGCRGLFPAFTDRFLMVYWDQFGCGINNHVIDERFSVKSFVDMTLDLVRELKALFPGNKVYFFGMSWGSVLCARALEAEENLVDGAVVYGQVVRNLFCNKEVLAALSGSRIPARKLERIRAIVPERITEDEMRLLSSSIRKYTDGYQNKKGKQAPVFPVIWGMLTSPDYRLRDFGAVVVNGYKGSMLYQELIRMDLSQALEHVEIPYVILQGDTDLVTPTNIVRKLVESSGNRCLQCKVLKHSGHMPGAEGMELVLAELIRLAYAEPEKKK